VIFTHSEMQHQIALETRDAYQNKLALSNYPMITTEITVAPTFYYAELYHQQYLAKNPDGYCGLKGTGVCF
jgi:peptide-methionine (S)-S-oxide reductase